MRNPDRIKHFCDVLAKKWSQVPDWRFTQLICNLFSEIGHDPFYIKDDKMLEIIENYLKEVV